MFGTPSDSDLTTIEIFIIATILVFIFMVVGYIIFRFLESDSSSREKQVTSPSKLRLEKLEKDYKWRLVKVIYIAFTGLITLGMGISAYEESKNRYPYREGNWGDTIWTVIFWGLVFWAIYRFLLPKLYLYLKPPNKPGP